MYLYDIYITTETYALSNTVKYIFLHEELFENIQAITNEVHSKAMADGQSFEDAMTDLGFFWVADPIFAGMAIIKE